MEIMEVIVVLACLVTFGFIMGIIECARHEQKRYEKTQAWKEYQRKGEQ